MLATDRAYRLAEPKVTAEEFDGEFVVLNLDSGAYFSFAGASAIVWQGLISGASPNQLISALEAGSDRANEVLTFIQQIVESGLVIESGEVGDEEGDNAFALQLAQSSDELVLEAFDDLAALLIADPIHEVEREAGWPHVVPQQQ